MYVRKFEAETLEAAIQDVKRELGPDAIILKTTTNKGLKGAFKRSRIEITAAISEESFVKKSNVDRVLNDNQKETFYKNSSERINKVINEYETKKPAKKSVDKSIGGYGSIGLNKVVNTVSHTKNKLKSSLDDFLSFDENQQHEVSSPLEEIQNNEVIENQYISSEASSSKEAMLELRHELHHQKNQIQLLEKKIFELTQNLNQYGPKDTEEFKGLSSLRMSLKTLDLDDKIVGQVLRKAHFELSKEELHDEEMVYDFALRELASMINTDMPLFSKIEMQDKPVITVLLSETSIGQTSFALKLAVLREDSVIVRFRMNGGKNTNHQFAKNFFNVDMREASSLSELISLCKKISASGKSIFLDLQTNSNEKDETRKVIESLKRGFDNMEILLTLSAINSELYNRKIISKYKEFSSGVIISYMDQCLSYGSILNAHILNPELPLKFFATGPVVPDDIETATKERLIAGLFQIS